MLPLDNQIPLDGLPAGSLGWPFLLSLQPLAVSVTIHAHIHGGEFLYLASESRRKPRMYLIFLLASVYSLRILIPAGFFFFPSDFIVTFLLFFASRAASKPFPKEAFSVEAARVLHSALCG